MRPFGPDSPWKLDPAITFLNHGSFGACPEPVITIRNELVERLEANPVAFLDTEREFEARLDAARREVAAFLGADPEGFVVVPNATTGISTVLRSLRFRPGDEILTTNHEYNAVLNAIQAVADEARGRLVRADIPLPIRHPQEVVEALLRLVTPRTRLAVVSHVTSPTGLVFPIEPIVRELDRLGVDTLVDAAHAPGMVPVDVAALGAAYWTGNGHKWLCGPKVSAALIVRPDRRSLMRPLVTSHGRNDPRPDRPPLWKAFDWQGTVDPTSFFALPEAIRIVGTLHRDGWLGIMADNRALALSARSELQSTLGVEPISPDEMIGSMASVRVPGLSTDAAAAALKAHLFEEAAIEVPTYGWPVRAARDDPADPPSSVLIRISAQRYNEPADYARLGSALVRHGVGQTASASGSTN